MSATVALCIMLWIIGTVSMSKIMCYVKGDFDPGIWIFNMICWPLSFIGCAFWNFD